MNRYERAALLDFVATVIWPGRTLRVAPGGSAVFTLDAAWNTTYDTPLAWVNGNRVTGAITWNSPTSVTLPVTPATGAQVLILVSPGAGAQYLPRNPAGVVAMLGDLLMGGFRIRNLGASVDPSDAVRRDEVDNLIATMLGGNYVAKAGDTMTGHLTLPTSAPGANQAVRKALVALLDASQDFTGKIKGVATEDADPDTTLTTKAWVLGKTVPFQAASLKNTTGSLVTDRKTLYRILVVGAGGSGGGGKGNTTGGFTGGGGGGGGGSGGAVCFDAVIDAGVTISWSLGVGGAQVAGSTNGNAGTATTLTFNGITVTATGGGAGQRGTHNHGSVSPGGAAGAGGTWSITGATQALEILASSSAAGGAGGAGAPQGSGDNTAGTAGSVPERGIATAGPGGARSSTSYSDPEGGGGGGGACMLNVVGPITPVPSGGNGGAGLGYNTGGAGGAGGLGCGGGGGGGSDDDHQGGTGGAGGNGFVIIIG